MNQKPLPNIQIKHIPDPNPWETLEVIPRLPVAGGVLLSLLLVACAAYQPSFLPQPAYTIPLLIACILALVTVVRSVAVGMACGALFVGGYVFGGFSLETGLALLCPIFVMGLGAYLIATYRSKWLALVPAGAYTLAFVLCGNPIVALISLISFPAAGILAHQTMRNQSRVSAICMTSLLYAICITFGYVLLLFLQNGSVSLQELAAALDPMREEITTLMLESEPLVQMLDKAYAGVGVSARDVIVSIVNLTFNLLPAMVITLINLMAFSAQLMCARAFVGTNMSSLLSRSAQLFILSVPSGMVYMFCFLVTMFSSASNMFTAATQNFLLILLPGMALIGMLKLVSDIKHGVSRFWILILVGCAVIAPSMLILVISFSGALTTITRPLITRMILKNQDKDGSSGPMDPR